MQDSIYHLTLKLYLICNFCIKMSRFRHQKRNVFMDVKEQCYEVKVICIFNPLMDYRS